MIWGDTKEDQIDRGSLGIHLQQEIHRLCGDSISPCVAMDVAQGVAVYWEQVLHETPLTSDYVAFLVSRALRSVGADFAADTVLAKQDTRVLREDTARYLPASAVSLQTWRMFTSLLVRPTRWTSYGEEVVWVLDFSRLCFDESHCFELSFTGSMRGVLLHLAEVWSETEGQGALGLKGIVRLDTLFPGWRDTTGTGDIAAWCREVLLGEAKRRGWPSVPRVMAIDAPAGRPDRKKKGRR